MKKYDHSKISKILLLIFNLILITIAIDQICSASDSDIIFILGKILLFLAALIVTGAMLAFLKPKTIKILLWPISSLAVLLVLI